MKPSETPPPEKEIPPITRIRQKRIREVIGLLSTGFTVSEVAKIHGISERQVRRDREDGKAFYQALSEAIDQKEIIGREIEGYKLAMDMEWRHYRTATNPFVKMGCMRNLIALKEKYIKFLQSAGLLDKAPEQINLGRTPLDLSAFTKEELELCLSIGLKLGGPLEGE